MDQIITILPAGPCHMQAVYGLMCELEGPDFDREGFQTVFEANLNNRDISYFLAMTDGVAAGFISLHVQRLLHHAASVGEVQELVITRGLRGKGVGKILFDAVKNAALGAGCVQLEVCCRKTNAPGCAFYQKMGMTASHDKLCLAVTEDA